jgi:hypothetical protein
MYTICVNYQHVSMAFAVITRVLYLYRLSDSACWALMNVICCISLQ